MVLIVVVVNDGFGGSVGGWRADSEETQLIRRLFETPLTKQGNTCFSPRPGQLPNLDVSLHITIDSDHTTRVFYSSDVAFEHR